MSGRANSRQLYSLTPRGYVLPDFVDHAGSVHSRPADNIPLMCWPDGSWCGIANSFMRELFEKNLSRRNRGGSLAVAAAHMSHLLRFCWARRINPAELTDGLFKEFVDNLKREASPHDASRKKRGPNSVIAIGRTCMGFLDAVGRIECDPSLIGPAGRVRAILREHRVEVRSGGHIYEKVVRYWHHSSFPNPGPVTKRMPINTASIAGLRHAVSTISTSSSQRSRRHTMLKLLECTGARRGEVALITTESVVDAEAMEHPMLRVPTLKKRGGVDSWRYVPISRSDLGFVRQYLDVHRRSVVRRKLKGADHGYLLVSDVTGKPLQINTITQEVRRLAASAGIKEKTCPHMFRHRFLTKLFVALIEQHRVNSVDEFRRLLIDGEELKRKVAEWSGHSRLETLDRYIELAFDEVTNFARIYKLTSAGLALDSFLGTLDAEMESMGDGDVPAIVLKRLRSHVERLKQDLYGAKCASVTSTAPTEAKVA
jgi:integrase